MRVDLVVDALVARTLDPAHPRASRIAVHGGRVALDEDVDGLKAKHRVRLDGASVVPGFSDAHCHPVLLG